MRVILRNEDVEEKNAVIRYVASTTEGLSGSDLRELSRHAAVYRVREYLQNEQGGGEPR